MRLLLLTAILALGASCSSYDRQPNSEGFKKYEKEEKEDKVKKEKNFFHELHPTEKVMAPR